ncbi:hypothetical protein PVAG01_05900 [Phlyctema vagabunda]|uniref:Uncharacterized protein n=1 Tax=Phlyctema vagabunda TaxID=108571 RepID=A0ABR4PEK7_9HELO
MPAPKKEQKTAEEIRKEKVRQEKERADDWAKGAERVQQQQRAVEQAVRLRLAEMEEYHAEWPEDEWEETQADRDLGWQRSQSTEEVEQTRLRETKAAEEQKAADEKKAAEAKKATTTRNTRPVGQAHPTAPRRVERAPNFSNPPRCVFEPEGRGQSSRTRAQAEAGRARDREAAAARARERNVFEDWRAANDARRRGEVPRMTPSDATRGRPRQSAENFRDRQERSRESVSPPLPLPIGMYWTGSHWRYMEPPLPMGQPTQEAMQKAREDFIALNTAAQEEQRSFIEERLAREAERLSLQEHEAMEARLARDRLAQLEAAQLREAEERSRRDYEAEQSRRRQEGIEAEERARFREAEAAEARGRLYEALEARLANLIATRERDASLAAERARQDQEEAQRRLREEELAEFRRWREARQASAQATGRAGLQGDHIADARAQYTRAMAEQYGQRVEPTDGVPMIPDRLAMLTNRILVERGMAGAPDGPARRAAEELARRQLAYEYDAERGQGLPGILPHPGGFEEHMRRLVAHNERSDAARTRQILSMVSYPPPPGVYSTRHPDGMLPLYAPQSPPRRRHRRSRDWKYYLTWER